MQQQNGARLSANACWLKPIHRVAKKENRMQIKNFSHCFDILVKFQPHSTGPFYDNAISRPCLATWLQIKEYCQNNSLWLRSYPLHIKRRQNISCRMKSIKVSESTATTLACIYMDLKNASCLISTNGQHWERDGSRQKPEPLDNQSECSS